MIKLFYAVGDSFVFGQEMGPPITPQNLHIFDDYKRRHCYTGIISDALKIENYKNSACPAASNERSYRMLINDITTAMLTYKPDEIFVNIGLTSATRREFCMNERGHYYLHMHTYEPSLEHNIQCHDLWKVIVKDFNHSLGDEMFNAMLILGMQNFLYVNKIPYLMSYSLRTPHGIAVTNECVPAPVLNQIRSRRFFSWPSFMEFVLNNSYDRGPGHHPLEVGHLAWAELLLRYINDNNLLDNSDL
jgi:hypothetical protein